MKKNIITIIVIVFLVIVGFALMAAPRQSRGPASLTGTIGSSSLTPNPLVAAEPSFDFGTISMARGKVNYSAAIKNTGELPVTITKLYTSCMCTSATMIRNGRRLGPFGMPGHGFTPSIKETLAPQEEVKVDVVFDPAAHGPAGIGRIERLIYVESDAGSPLTFGFTVTVTP